MFDDDEVKRPKSHEVGMPIDTMSVAELEERIGLLVLWFAQARAVDALMLTLGREKTLQRITV